LKRSGNLFAQWEFGYRAEAGQQVVVDGNRLRAAAESAEPEPLVEERIGDLFAERRLGCSAEAGQQIVVDSNFLGAAIERTEPEPLVDERPGDLVASGRAKRKFRFPFARTGSDSGLTQ